MPAAKKGDAAKRLTLAEVERIVELRLTLAMSFRAIAADVGCDKNTVVRQWEKWLDESAADRNENRERYRADVLARMNTTATDARQNRARVRQSMDDPDQLAKAEARYMAEETKALVALAKVGGYEAPTQIGISHQSMTESEAAAILAEDD